jgi:hypothetical protein
MTAMGWGAVWQAAWTQFGAEPVEVRLLILVAAAFFALMILIGLSHAFRPASPKALAASKPLTVAEPPPLARALTTPPSLEPVSKPLPQPFRLRMLVLRAARKSGKRTMNRQRALRPKIRRAERLTEIDAPTSPLPPRR